MQKQSPKTHPVPRGLLLFCPPPTAPGVYCSPGRIKNGNIFRIFLEYLFYCHCATWNGIILHPIRREHVHCLVHFMQNYIFATFMQICRIMDVYFIMLPKYFVRFLPPRPWCVPRRIWCQFLRHHLYQFCCKFPKIKDKVLKLKNLWETGNWGKVESF